MGWKRGGGQSREEEQGGAEGVGRGGGELGVWKAQGRTCPHAARVSTMGGRGGIVGGAVLRSQETGGGAGARRGLRTPRHQGFQIGHHQQAAQGRDQLYCCRI